MTDSQECKPNRCPKCWTTDAYNPNIRQMKDGLLICDNCNFVFTKEEMPT